LTDKTRAPLAVEGDDSYLCFWIGWHA